MSSTETPGGPGIPAGWYDNPSGEGLRWWDGERWTEHVHTAEPAAAAADGADDSSPEGAPPRDLVKLRESIRGRGSKGVGMILGALVLVVVVVALLVSGGSEGNGGVDGGRIPGAGGTGGAASKEAKEALRAVERQLQKGKLSKAEEKALEAEVKAIEGGHGKSPDQQVEAAEAAVREALRQSHN